MNKVKEALQQEKTKEGLPKEAFAIVGDPQDPETWKLPHHTKAILRAKGRLDIEKTVDWERIPAAVASLSRGGYRGDRPPPRKSSRPPATWPTIIRRPVSPSRTLWEPLSSVQHTLSRMGQVELAGGIKNKRR